MAPSFMMPGIMRINGVTLHRGKKKPGTHRPGVTKIRKRFTNGL